MPDPTSATSAIVDLAETSASRVVNVPLGHQLRLTLVENRTTGFQWKLSEACSALLTLETDSASAPSEQQPGAPGTHVWTFRARAAGSCEIRAISVRPWAAGETGKVLAFPVTVIP